MIQDVQVPLILDGEKKGKKKRSPLFFFSASSVLDQTLVNGEDGIRYSNTFCSFQPTLVSARNDHFEAFSKPSFFSCGKPFFVCL